jgi:hypothetical protein
MTARWSIVAFSLALSACHGIEYPTAPAPAPARSQTPVKMSVVMSPAELPVGGGSAVLIVETLGADGSGVETSVTLSASGGELGTSQLQTDRTGHAKGSWVGTQTATLTATAGAVTAVSSLRVIEPTKLPPPSVPPPPTPTPTPEPLPTPAPALSLAVSATPLQVTAGSPTTLTATVQNLNAGESVTAYQWDWDGNGTTEETTIDAARAHAYATDGIMAPIVKILTSGGRTATGTGRVIVAVAPPPPPPPPPPPALPPLLVSLTPSSTTPVAGASVTFTATVTSIGTVPSGLTYEWDFQNDGTFDQVTSVNSTSTSFTAGSKTVKVRVTAPDGRTVSNTTTVTAS